MFHYIQYYYDNILFFVSILPFHKLCALGKYTGTLYTVHPFNYKLQFNCCYGIDTSYNGKYNFGKRGLC